MAGVLIKCCYKMLCYYNHIRRSQYCEYLNCRLFDLKKLHYSICHHPPVSILDHQPQSAFVHACLPVTYKTCTEQSET